MRVLVVSEDVKERARASSALLLDTATEVVEATSAEEARRRIIAEGERYDVLVVDGDMQPRGGFAMLYDLRARADLGDLPAVPSVVLASREQDRWLGGWSGANVVMLKPVDPFELRREVASLEGADPAPYGDAESSARQVAAATRDHRR